MTRRKVVVLTVVVAALFVGAGSVAIAQMSSGNAKNVGTANSESCLRFDANGEQAWSGKASAKLNALANKVQALVDKNTDVATGVALCSGFDGVAAFVTPNASALKIRLDELSKEAPYPVVTYEVSSSLKTLLAAGTSLVKQGLPSSVIGFSPDTYTGGLRIAVRAGANQKEAAALVHKLLSQSGYSNVKVVTGPGSEATAA